MLSPIDALRLKIKSFFRGLGVYSNGFIIESDLGEEDFQLIWDQEKENFIKEHQDSLKNYVELKYNSKITPKAIFDFLCKNKLATIFFSADDAIKILESTACIKIIEGAVCSSPDSGSKWLVQYKNEDGFIFSGYLIMHIKIDSIKLGLQKYHYLLRDKVIINIDKLTSANSGS